MAPRNGPWPEGLDFGRAELEEVARQLNRHFPATRLWALSGPLGAGKTTLAKALVRQWGVQGGTGSPSFALVQTYASPQGPVHHVDAYRLEGLEQALEAGLDDVLNGPHRCVVEWPEILAPLLPPDALFLNLDVIGEDRRHLSIRPNAQPPIAQPRP